MKSLAIAFALTFCMAAHAAAPIVIGQSAPLTGPAAAAGKAFVDGARAYINDVNRAGGVRGRSIELRTLDDAYDPSRAAENAKTLIDEGALGLFGFINTPASVAGAAVATQHKVPFIAPASGVSSLRQPGNDYIFNVRASFKDEATRITSHLETVGVERISFFSLFIPESKVMFEHMGGLLAKSGRKFYTAVNVQPGAVDLAKAAADLKPKETQAVVLFCPGKMCADLIHELRKQGGSALTYYTISSAGDVFGELATKGASIAVTQVMPYPWVSGAFPVVDRYQKAMTSAGKTDFGYWSLEGYISAQVLVEGLRRMDGNDKPTPGALAEAMRSIGRLNFGGFEVVLDRAYRNGSRYTDITLARSAGKYRR
jgi:branched-chain amino acid transport system substrate-binding protein